jgi:hypothetical protein
LPLIFQEGYRISILIRPSIAMSAHQKSSWGDELFFCEKIKFWAFFKNKFGAGACLTYLCRDRRNAEFVKKSPFFLKGSIISINSKLHCICIRGKPNPAVYNP